MWVSKKKLAEIIDEVVKRELKKRIDDTFIYERTPEPPIGFNPLPAIMGNRYRWVLLPFAGTLHLCKVKFNAAVDFITPDEEGNVYNFVQIILDVDSERKKDPNKVKFKDVVDFTNTCERLAKLTLCVPTYEEFAEAFFKDDVPTLKAKVKCEELRKRIEMVKDPVLKAALRKEIDETQISCAWVLPQDTMSAISRIALGTDVTDITKITEKILHNAYENHLHFGGNVLQYIPAGVYTDLQGMEIERVAQHYYFKWERENNPKEWQVIARRYGLIKDTKSRAPKGGRHGRR